MRKLNVDHHSDEDINKTIEKDIGKHSAECAGGNLDKSVRFIFDGSEQKIEAKILRILKLMLKT